MKDVYKLVIAFLCWCVILLSAFMLIVLTCAPGFVIAKPVIFTVCVLIIVCAIAVKIFDPAFSKKITSSTGK